MNSIVLSQKQKSIHQRVFHDPVTDREPSVADRGLRVWIWNNVVSKFVIYLGVILFNALYVSTASLRRFL